MKISHVKTEVKHHHDGSKVKVSGMFKMPNGGFMPFDYEVKHEQEFDHDSHLAAWYEKATEHNRRVPEFHAWELGVLKASDGILCTVTDCNIQMHGHTLWRVYIRVEEILSTGPQYIEMSWDYIHPKDIQPHDWYKAEVQKRIDERAERRKKINSHIGTLDAIANTFKA